MPSIANAHDAAVLLRDRLDSRLRDDYPDLNAARGGVRVVLKDDEPTEPKQGSGTVAKLDGTDGPSEWGKPFRDVTIDVEVWANDTSGGKTGAVNEDSSGTQLAATITEIVQEDYAWLRDNGLVANDIRTIRRTYGEGDARDGRVTGMEFTCKIDVS